MIARRHTAHSALQKTKADVTEHPEVFHDVGLLFNGFPGIAELPFI